MAITLVIAVVLTVAGLTVLRSWLDPHEHPWRFILYWLVCAWEIVLVFLLALFDLLMVRAQTRATKRLLEEQFRIRKLARIVRQGGRIISLRRPGAAAASATRQGARRSSDTTLTVNAVRRNGVR